MKLNPITIALLTSIQFSLLQAQSFDMAKLDLFLNRLAEKHKGMGSLVIAKDGKLLYNRSVGFAQVGAGVEKPNSADTKFRIASITKTYTTVLTFQLIEGGKLSLNTTLDKYFPQIPNASKITIAHILSHRSGIHEIEVDGVWGKQSRTQEEIIARIAQGQPDFEPGSKHKYSNASFNLLGFVVEKASGRSYADALKHGIVDRLDLHNTYAGVGQSNPAKNEALSYRYIGGWQEAAELDFSVPGGAGAILSTPTDMAIFIQALFDGKLISNESLKLMTTLQDGEGMGLEPFTFAGKSFFGHTGGSVASGAWLAYSPEERLVIAYACNGKIYPVKDIIGGALDIFWNRPFQLPTFEAFAVSAELLDSYAGVYSIAGTPARIVIARSGNTLSFQPPNQSAVNLEATAANVFKLEPFLSIEFDTAKKEMAVTRAGQTRVFKKEEQ